MRLISLVADKLALAHSMHQALPSLPCCVGLHANFGTSHFQAFQVPTQHAILAFFPLSFFTPCQPNYFFFVVVRCAGCPISAPPPLSYPKPRSPADPSVLHSNPPLIFKAAQSDTAAACDTSQSPQRRMPIIRRFGPLGHPDMLSLYPPSSLLMKEGN